MWPVHKPIIAKLFFQQELFIFMPKSHTFRNFDGIKIDSHLWFFILNEHKLNHKDIWWCLKFIEFLLILRFDQNHVHAYHRRVYVFAKYQFNSMNLFMRWFFLLSSYHVTNKIAMTKWLKSEKALPTISS